MFQHAEQLIIMVQDRTTAEFTEQLQKYDIRTCELKLERDNNSMQQGTSKQCVCNVIPRIL
jgi:hypothetical protein